MTRRHERLLAAVAVAVLGAACSPARGQVVNLAINHHFTANCHTLPGWDGLLDGVKNSDDPPGCWASDNSPNFPKYVVIDLGGLCEVSRVVVHNSTNGNTKQIRVSVSTDAKNYDLLREYVFPPGKYQPLTHSFTPRKARFVRITFVNTWGGGIGGDNIIYLREVEVFGRRLEKAPTGLNALWHSLAAAPPYSAIPGWPAVRRYLRELRRPVRLAVICASSDADEIVGPDGWLSEGLRLVERSLGEASWIGPDAEVRVFETDDPAQMLADWASAYPELPPDIIVAAPPAAVPGAVVEALAAALARARRDGSSVAICLPAPAGPDQDASKYQTVRRRLRALAAELQAGVLDIAATLAHRYKLADVAGGPLAADQRSLLAEAWARMFR